MTIKELQHIIATSGDYDLKDDNDFENFLEEVHNPIIAALERKDEEVLHYLMNCNQDDLGYVAEAIASVTDVTNDPELLELHTHLFIHEDRGLFAWMRLEDGSCVKLEYNYDGNPLTIQRLQDILKVSGKYNPYNLEFVKTAKECFSEIEAPIMYAVSKGDIEIIDYLIACDPEELIYVDSPICTIIKNSKKDTPELNQLLQKLKENAAHIMAVLNALKQEYDEGCETADIDVDATIRLRPDLVEGITLTPKQLDLWAEILEREAKYVAVKYPHLETWGGVTVLDDMLSRM